MAAYTQKNIAILGSTGSVGEQAIDVAEKMGYSKPSVSRAVGLLKKGEFLTVDAGGSLVLTEKGKEAAKSIFERHTVLTAFLTKVGVDAETAAIDACRIEHVISAETLDAIKKFTEKN